MSPRPQFNPRQIATTIDGLIRPLLDSDLEWRVSTDKQFSAPGVVQYRVWTIFYLRDTSFGLVPTLNNLAELISRVVDPLGLRYRAPYNPGWDFGQREYRWELTRGKKVWRVWMPCYLEGQQAKVNIQVVAVQRGKPPVLTMGGKRRQAAGGQRAGTSRLSALTAAVNRLVRR